MLKNISRERRGFYAALVVFYATTETLWAALVSWLLKNVQSNTVFRDGMQYLFEQFYRLIISAYAAFALLLLLNVLRSVVLDAFAARRLLGHLGGPNKTWLKWTVIYAGCAALCVTLPAIYSLATPDTDDLVRAMTDRFTYTAQPERAALLWLLTKALPCAALIIEPVSVFFVIKLALAGPAAWRIKPTSLSPERRSWQLTTWRVTWPFWVCFGISEGVSLSKYLLARRFSFGMDLSFIRGLVWSLLAPFLVILRYDYLGGPWKTEKTRVKAGKSVLAV